MKNFLSKLKNNFIMQFLFCVISTAVVFGVYFIGISIFDRESLLEQPIINDTMVTQEIESCKVDKKSIILSGWALRNEAECENINIILKAIENDETFLMNTKQCLRQDVSEYFLENWNYGKIGYVSKIERDKIADDMCYEIILAMKYYAYDSKNECKVSTGKYLYKNEIYSYNPTNFSKPEFESEELNLVVNNGELCHYDAVKKIYIYKYDTNFYWIIDEESDLEKEDYYVLYHVGSSKYQELSEHMKKYGCEAYNFYFQDKELNLSSNEKYRVACYGVPNGYPETYFYTAFMNHEQTEMLWEGYFYPTYKFDERGNQK